MHILLVEDQRRGDELHFLVDPVRLGFEAAEALHRVEWWKAAWRMAAEATATREHEDLTAGRPEVVADGRRRIAVPAEAARLAALPRQQVTGTTDTARLEALGYIQKAADADAGADADADSSGADADAE